MWKVSRPMREASLFASQWPGMSYKRPFVIGITGGASSGKTEVCSTIQTELRKRYPQEKILILSMDDFYRSLTPEQVEQVNRAEYNFDHPDAIDFDLLLRTMNGLLERSLTAPLPKYNMQTHTNSSSCPPTSSQCGEGVNGDEHDSLLSPLTQFPDVIILSGIFMLYHPEIRAMVDLKVFLDVDPDVRLSRQIVRDMMGARYQKTLEQVVHDYMTHVKPSYEEFIFPTKKYSDIVIPRGEDNQVAVELLIQHILDILRADQQKEKQSPEKKRYSATLTVSSATEFQVLDS